MSSHETHNHPATPAARAACRRRSTRPQDDPNMIGRVLEFAPVGIPTFTRTTADHCELCGTVDIESLTTGDQGYTACCNELVCHGTTTSVWAWDDLANMTQGTIEACCSALITLPHDMMAITHRVN